MPRSSKVFWRKDLEPRKRLFSEEFKRTLRDEFRLTEQGMDFLADKLTDLVVYNRSPYLSVLPIICEPAEGTRLVKEALAEVSRARNSLREAERLMSELKFVDSKSDTNFEYSKFMTNRFSKARDEINRLMIALGLTARHTGVQPILPGAIGTNRRSAGLTPQEKRRLFVKVCLQCRALEGKHIGYTTSESGRGGETIRFVHAVFSELSTPESKLPAATVRTDIREWMKKSATRERVEKILKNQ